jgi:hypothetical protein
MKILTYQVACKSCLRSDGENHMIMIMDSFEDFSENRLLKSEYQLGKYVVKYLNERGKPCQFCQSTNLEISNIEFDGIKALVGRNIDQFQLVISKHENGQVEMKPGGSQYLPKGFLNEAFELIDKAQLDTPMSECEEKSIGNIRIVVSTRTIGNDDYRTNRLEQFSFVGFDKETIVNMIDQIKSHIIKQKANL